MSETLSGFSYLIELVLTITNPSPLFVISESTVLPYVLGSTFLLLLGISRISIHSTEFLNSRSGLLVATCVAALAIISLASDQQNILVTLSLTYALTFRMIDGLLVGIALTVLAQCTRESVRPFRACAIDLTAMVFLIQILGWLLSVVGLVTVIRRVPLLGRDPILIVSITGFTLCGNLLMVSVEETVVRWVYLGVFPISVGLGVAIESLRPSLMKR